MVHHSTFTEHDHTIQGDDVSVQVKIFDWSWQYVPILSVFIPNVSVSKIRKDVSEMVFCLLDYLTVLLLDIDCLWFVFAVFSVEKLSSDHRLKPQWNIKILLCRIWEAFPTTLINSLQTERLTEIWKWCTYVCCHCHCYSCCILVTIQAATNLWYVFSDIASYYGNNYNRY